MNVQRFILSLLAGCIIVSLLIHPVQGILDVPHQSCLFSTIFLSLFIGIVSLILSKRRKLRIAVIDLLFILLVIIEVWSYPPASNLFSLGRFALIAIYWGIRQAGKLNAIVLYATILIFITSLSIYGYLQLLNILPSHHDSFYMTGPFGNPTIYAGVLCMLMSPLIIMLSYCRKKKVFIFRNFFSITVCIFALPALYLTHCRSAWMALLFCTVYLLIQRFSSSVRRRWIIRYTFLLIIFLGCFFYFYKPGSVHGRILIWKVTTQMIKEKPIGGFGPNGFITEYMNYQGDYLKTQDSKGDKQFADNNHYVYNEPLRWMVEYGLAGLILYIGIVYAILSFKPKGVSSLSAKMICVSALIWGLFSYPSHAYPILVIMTMAMAEMANHQRESLICISPQWHIYHKIFVCTIIVVQSYLLVQMYGCHQTLFQIIQRNATDKSEEAIVDLSQLEAVMKDERIFWIHYCRILSESHQYNLLLKKIAHWERLYPSTHTYILKGEALRGVGKMKEAEESFWTAHYMVPSRQKARYKLALLYNQEGRLSEAMQLANEILTEKVKIYGFETYEIHRNLRQIFGNKHFYSP